MPATVLVKVVEARGLPIMDRATDSTDAYVQVKFASKDVFNESTKVAKQTLNPHWNETFRIEVYDDEMLQDFPVELKVIDKDVMTSGQQIGVVCIDLIPLLTSGTDDRDELTQIAGWFPIVDSLGPNYLHGELNISVRISFFGDVNPFKESGTGVEFFSSCCVPEGMQLSPYGLQGFVEELIVRGDTEFQWMNMVRASQTSNDARQLLLYELAGKLRRQIGRKVLAMGGNAVLGYQQNLDLEDDDSAAIVARGYGTAVCIVAKNTPVRPY